MRLQAFQCSSILIFCVSVCVFHCFVSIRSFQYRRMHMYMDDNAFLLSVFVWWYHKWHLYLFRWNVTLTQWLSRSQNYTTCITDCIGRDSTSVCARVGERKRSCKSQLKWDILRPEPTSIHTYALLLPQWIWLKTAFLWKHVTDIFIVCLALDSSE